MKIEVHENTLKIKTFEGDLIRTSDSVSYIIYPEVGKKLRNKKTGYTTDSYIGVSSIDKINNYEEVE